MNIFLTEHNCSTVQKKYFFPVLILYILLLSDCLKLKCFFPMILLLANNKKYNFCRLIISLFIFCSLMKQKTLPFIYVLNVKYKFLIINIKEA